MSLFLVPSVIRVEIPALDNLINFLKTNQANQAAIDAQTNKLKLLNDDLEKVVRGN